MSAPVPPTAADRISLAQNALGFLLVLAGFAFLVWDRYEHVETMRSIIQGGVLIALGAWLVASPQVKSFVDEVQDVAPSILAARAGRPVRASDPEPATVTAKPDQSTIVARAEAETVVVPPKADPVVVPDPAPLPTVDEIKASSPRPVSVAPKPRRRRLADRPPEQTVDAEVDAAMARVAAGESVRAEDVRSGAVRLTRDD